MTSHHKALIAQGPISQVEIKKWQHGQIEQRADHVAEEVPIALIYNGVSHAVMLASPQDLEDFALGFSLAEGILNHAKELYGLEINIQENGIELHLEIASEQFSMLKERRRSMAGRTGCGLCGAESLGQALRLPKHQVAPENFEMSKIQLGLAQIGQFQHIQQLTGATHACALVSHTGEVLLVREDVGRHNALDKLLGAKAKLADCVNAFVMTTSRASYEMVQKVAVANIPLLVAISAPTGLAIRLAEQCNIALVGFARNNDCVVYTHAERILTNR